MSIYRAVEFKMMASSHVTFPALLAHCEGNPLLNGGVPHKEPVMRCFAACSQPDEAREQTVEFPIIWDPITFMWHHFNADWYALIALSAAMDMEPPHIWQPAGCDELDLTTMCDDVADQLKIIFLESYQLNIWLLGRIISQVLNR